MTASLLALLLTQTASAPVTVHIRPVSLPVAVQRIAEATHRNLGVSDELKELVVMVDASDAEPDELLHELAEAAAADWADRDGKLVLRRSGSKLNTLEAEFRVKKIEYVNKSLKYLDKITLEPLSEQGLTQSLQEQRDFYERMERGEIKPNEKPPRYVDPNSRMLARLRKSFPIADLVSLRPGERVVYCTRPTAMQRMLGSGILEALEISRREQDLFNRVSQQIYRDISPSEEGPTPAVDGAPATEVLRAPAQPATQPKTPGPCVVATIAISRSFGALSGMYQVLVTGYDANGQVTVSANHAISAGILNPSMEGYGDGESDAEPTESPNPKPKPKPPVDFPLSPFASEIRKMITSWSTSGEGRTATASPQLVNFLLDPVQFEPLDTLPADGLTHLAKETKRNYVAVMDDSWFFANIFATEFRSEPDPSALFGPLFARRTEDKNWVRYTPYELRSAPAFKMSRLGLGTFMKRAKQFGLVSLDDVANLSIQSEMPVMESLGIFYLYMLDQMIANSTFRYGSEPWLKIYGNLPGSLRQDLARGRILNYQQLPSGAKSQIYSLVYGASSMEYQSVAEDGDEAQAAPTEGTIPQNQPAAWMMEPTFAFPNNVPFATTLKATVVTSTVMYGSRDKNPSGLAMYPVTARTIGYYLAAKESGQEQDVGEFPMYFALGNQTKWNFELRLSPESVRRGTLTDSGAVDRSKLFSPSELPQEIQAQIQKYKAEYLKMFKDERDPGENPPGADRP